MSFASICVFITHLTDSLDKKSVYFKFCVFFSVNCHRFECTWKFCAKQMSKAHVRMQNTLNKMSNCEQRKIWMIDLISNSYGFGQIIKFRIHLCVCLLALIHLNRMNIVRRDGQKIINGTLLQLHVNTRHNPYKHTYKHRITIICDNEWDTHVDSKIWWNSSI